MGPGGLWFGWRWLAGDAMCAILVLVTQDYGADLAAAAPAAAFAALPAPLTVAARPPARAGKLNSLDVSQALRANRRGGQAADSSQRVSPGPAPPSPVIKAGLGAAYGYARRSPDGSAGRQPQLAAVLERRKLAATLSNWPCSTAQGIESASSAETPFPASQVLTSEAQPRSGSCTVRSRPLPGPLFSRSWLTAPVRVGSTATRK